MKSLIVATDLSERSDRAVARAMRLATEFGATCHVLTVVDSDWPGDIAQKLCQDAKKRLQAQVEGLSGKAAICHIDAVLGDPLDKIAVEADRLDVDLVVLGLHRQRMFMDMLRDTTMERLVKLNRRPVLLVKNPSAAPYRTVLVPVSFSASCAAALRLARVLAPDARLTKFHALHVPFAGLTSDQPDSHATRQMLAEAEAQRSLWARIHDLPDDLADVPVLTGGLSQVLASQIKATSPDLICIGAHSRSGLSPYTLGSFAAQLIRDPATDLLIVRPTLPN